MNDVDTVDLNCDDTNRNMYGCLPCPKCKSTFRASYIRSVGNQKHSTIECDDCGYISKTEFL